jgi:hypothetical protein
MFSFSGVGTLFVGTSIKGTSTIGVETSIKGVILLLFLRVLFS